MPKTRKFDGKTYHEAGGHRLKSNAKKSAKKKREEGKYARVVKRTDKPGYLVYERGGGKKKKKR